MKPAYLYRTEIDTHKWNRCIQHARFSCIYAYSWYLDIVCPQWDAVVLQTDEEYLAVMPLPLQKRWLFTVIAQPFYCQYLGIFATEEISLLLLDTFLSVVLKKRYYISSYSFHPTLYPILQSSNLFTENFKSTQYYTEFFYFNSYCNQSLSYSRDRKKNLQKGIHFNWELEISSDLQPIIHLFKENHELTFPKGIHPRSYSWLQAIVDGLHANVTIWYARKDDVIHGGILIIHYNGQHYYLFNAADSIGKKFNARTWLLDQYLHQIRYEAEFFDFESAQKPTIRAHYQTFGAHAIPFFVVRKNTLPFPINIVQEIRILWHSTTT